MLKLKSIQYAVRALEEQKKPRYEPDLSDIPGDRLGHHEWHWGEPNSGKSYYCQQRPGTFKKKSIGFTMNMYAHQPFVHCDDVGLEAGCFVGTNFYKQLLDQTPFIADCKYDNIEVRPRSVRVSSNHHPSKIWTGIDLKSIMSRVTIYHWSTEFKDPNWINPVTLQTKGDLEAPPPIPDV